MHLKNMQWNMENKVLATITFPNESNLGIKYPICG